MVQCNQSHHPNVPIVANPLPFHELNHSFVYFSISVRVESVSSVTSREAHWLIYSEKEPSVTDRTSVRPPFLIHHNLGFRGLRPYYLILSVSLIRSPFDCLNMDRRRVVDDDFIQLFEVLLGLKDGLGENSEFIFENWYISQSEKMLVIMKMISIWWVVEITVLYHILEVSSWNTRRCSGFKIKWKNSSDMFLAGFWIVATPNLVGIG
jgi:hypothetical protein